MGHRVRGGEAAPSCPARCCGAPLRALRVAALPVSQHFLAPIIHLFPLLLATHLFPAAAPLSRCYCASPAPPSQHPPLPMSWHFSTSCKCYKNTMQSMPSNTAGGWLEAQQQRQRGVGPPPVPHRPRPLLPLPPARTPPAPLPLARPLGGAQPLGVHHARVVHRALV